MDPAVLDERGRADVLSFFGEVFGWTEGDNTGEAGNPLILYTGAFGQFVYLLPADPPLTAPPLDHFGLQVETLADLHAIVGLAKSYATRDDRVHVIDVHARTTHGSKYRHPRAGIEPLQPPKSATERTLLTAPRQALLPL